MGTSSAPRKKKKQLLQPQPFCVSPNTTPGPSSPVGNVLTPPQAGSSASPTQRRGFLSCLRMLYKAKLFPAPFLPLSRLPWASTSWRRSGSGTWNPGTQQEQPPGGGNTPQGPHVVCPEQAKAEMTQNSWHIFGVFTPGPTGKAPKVGTVMLVPPPT